MVIFEALLTLHNCDIDERFPELKVFRHNNFERVRTLPQLEQKTRSSGK